MPTDTHNPAQGGSYQRDPETGALTPLAQPEEATAQLRRHADDEPAQADPAATATTSPQPEA